MSEKSVVYGSDIMQAYVWLKNYNMLPYPGTWVKQPSIFIKCVEWLDIISGAWQRKQQEIKATQQKLVNQLGRMSGGRR